VKNKRRGAEQLLDDWVRSKTNWFMIPFTRLLARAGISPNVLTLIGFLLNVIVAWLLAIGQQRLGGVVFIFAGLCDSLDGTLAREMATTSRFGAFFDSVLDRFSEGIVFFGLLLSAFKRGDLVDLILIYAAVIGSVIVSYTRARAEGIGVECRTGLFTRFERFFILMIALLLGQVRLALWVLAVFANFTALQRIYHVWQATRKGKD